MIKLSIIITLHNSELYLFELFLSLARAVNFSKISDKIEIIFIDDCSKDNTKIIVDNFIKKKIIKCKVLLLKTLVNSGGPAKPRNIGILSSSGEYLFFLDHDDLINKKIFEIYIDIINKLKVEFISGSVSFNNYYKKKVNNVQYIAISFLKIILFNPINLSGSCIKKNTLESKFYFNESKEFIAVEDFLFWINLFKQKKIKAIKLKNKLIFYRNNKNSLSSNKLRHAFKVYKVYKTLNYNLFYNIIFMSIYVIRSVFKMIRKQFEKNY